MVVDDGEMTLNSDPVLIQNCNLANVPNRRILEGDALDIICNSISKIELIENEKNSIITDSKEEKGNIEPKRISAREILQTNGIFETKTDEELFVVRADSKFDIVIESGDSITSSSSGDEDKEKERRAVEDDEEASDDPLGRGPDGGFGIRNGIQNFSDPPDGLLDDILTLTDPPQKYMRPSIERVEFAPITIGEQAHNYIFAGHNRPLTDRHYLMPSSGVQVLTGGFQMPSVVGQQDFQVHYIDPNITGQYRTGGSCINDCSLPLDSEAYVGDLMLEYPNLDIDITNLEDFLPENLDNLIEELNCIKEDEKSSLRNSPTGMDSVIGSPISSGVSSQPLSKSPDRESILTCSPHSYMPQPSPADSGVVDDGGEESRGSMKRVFETYTQNVYEGYEMVCGIPIDNQFSPAIPTCVEEKIAEFEEIYVDGKPNTNIRHEPPSNKSGQMDRIKVRGTRKVKDQDSPKQEFKQLTLSQGSQNFGEVYQDRTFLGPMIPETVARAGCDVLPGGIKGTEGLDGISMYRGNEAMVPGVTCPPRVTGSSQARVLKTPQNHPVKILPKMTPPGPTPCTMVAPINSQQLPQQQIPHVQQSIQRQLLQQSQLQQQTTVNNPLIGSNKQPGIQNVPPQIHDASKQSAQQIYNASTHPYFPNPPYGQLSPSFMQQQQPQPSIVQQQQAQNQPPAAKFNPHSLQQVPQQRRPQEDQLQTAGQKADRPKPPLQSRPLTRTRDEEVRVHRALADITREGLLQQDADGHTMVHVAAMHGEITIVRLEALIHRLKREGLLEQVLATGGRENLTPLCMAVFYNHSETAKLLLENGADPNVRILKFHEEGVNEYNLLHFIATKGSIMQATLEQLLSDPKTAVNVFDSQGLTPLHWAVKHHRPRCQQSNGLVDSQSVIFRLAMSGADLNIADRCTGRTPLHYAIEKRDKNLVEWYLGLALHVAQKRHTVNGGEALEDQQMILQRFLGARTRDGLNAMEIARALKPDNQQKEEIIRLLQNKATGMAL